jgi:aspartate aminotransferase-like enzyme
MLPGPTPIPEEGLIRQSQQIIGHREEAFSKLYFNITENLKKVFMTKNDVLIFPASGTGGLEISIVNTLSPGDTVLSINNGFFSQRFRDIASSFGIKVIELSSPWGKACNLSELEKILIRNKDVKAVLFTHNETSTGVQNNVKEIGKIIKNFDAILIVDAVSSLAGLPLHTDDWYVDIAITSSQKALMTPPGLTILSISDKAWNYINNSTMPRYYFDLLLAKKYYIERNQTPFTPAISLLYSLDAALKIILDKGLNNVFKEHKLFTKALRKGFINLKLKPFVPWEIASYTVSSFYQPEGINFPEFKLHLLNKYKFHIADGQKELKDIIFRIGHLGYIKKKDIISAVERMGKGLLDYKFNINIDLALEKTMEVLNMGVIEDV